MRLRLPVGGASLYRGIAAAIIVTGLVAACAESPFSWGGRKQSTGKWPTENSSCRDYAKRKSEQEYALVRSSGPALGYTRTSVYAGQRDRYDATRRQEQLFNLCMKQRGYRAPEVEDEDKDKESP